MELQVFIVLIGAGTVILYDCTINIL
jgi:hypothetical protein